MLAVVAAMWMAPAGAQEIITRTKQAEFDDVRMDLNSAILATGVTIQSQGNIAAMLGKTAGDLGANETVYARAEFVAICSAHYSRAMMEADPTNLAFCPFTVFVYEAKSKPGEIVVGFRPVQVPAAQNDRAKAAADDVNKLLAGILERALK